jgi:FkbM family methyltransferase
MTVMESQPFGAAKFPLLHALLDEAAIKLVDIGGRGSALPSLLCLAPFSGYYVSEPDREEADRLRQHLPTRAPWRTVTVFPEAIASRRGEATLYVTAEPGMSSLLEPDVQIARRFCLGNKFRVQGTINVPTVPLDDAATQYGFGDACFLKLDTQGTELDILQSGSRLVDESVLGVHVECLFHPFYKGQALFGDVDAYLRARGLVLVSLSRTNLRRASYRTNIYSRRVTAWAHCLYLREPETLAASQPACLRHRASRLLGLMLAFEQYDLALEVAAVFRRIAIVDERDATRLSDEMRRKCRDSTRHIARRAEAEGVDAEALLASSFRDQNRLE